METAPDTINNKTSGKRVGLVIFAGVVLLLSLGLFLLNVYDAKQREKRIEREAQWAEEIGRPEAGE